MEKRVILLSSGSSFLAKKGVANAKGNAEIFLSHILNCPRIELYLDNLAVEERQSRHYWDLLTERARGVPLQYLVGSTEFMGLEFKIRPGVFIPRPETEILVEAAIELLTNKLTNGSTSSPSLEPSRAQSRGQLANKLKILDIGTGCGNIAISIAGSLRSARIFACDISDSALQLTKENSSLNKVRICLLQSNLFSAFKKRESFSLIVSNPPYVNTQEIPGLIREIHHEPKLALDGGRDGLFYYRKIINQAPVYLEDRGLLVLEIGDNQKPLVQEIFAQSGRLSLIKTVRDYNDVERVVIAQKTG